MSHRHLLETLVLPLPSGVLPTAPAAIGPAIEDMIRRLSAAGLESLQERLGAIEAQLVEPPGADSLEAILARVVKLERGLADACSWIDVLRGNG